MPLSPVTLGVLVLGLLAGSALIGYGGLKLRSISRMRQQEPISVRKLACRSGPVEVLGTATVEEETVVAPFSGCEGVAHRYAVEEYRQSGETSYWETR